LSGVDIVSESVIVVFGVVHVSSTIIVITKGDGKFGNVEADRSVWLFVVVN